MKKTVRAHFATSGGKHDLMEAKCPYCGHLNYAEDGHLAPVETDTCRHFSEATAENKFVFTKKTRL